MIRKKLHLLIIDNYDSFSYNLVEHLRAFDEVSYVMLKHDDDQLFNDDYDGLIISPGPGLPFESGLLMKAIEFYIGRIPIFGVCLGLQAIVEYYGGRLKQLDTVFHGIKDQLEQVQESPLFTSVSTVFQAGRYHSWVAARQDLPVSLEIIAEDRQGTIMGVQNQKDHCYAVQFHPESYMTEEGYKMFNNFIALVHRFQEEKSSQISEFTK